MHPIARSILIAALGIAALSLAACSSSPGPTASSSPTVDEATATDMARRALDALNAGDYAAWSRDWSDTLRAGIDESAFLTFRNQAIAQLGAYVSIEAVSLTSVKAGTYRWVFTVRFEKATATLALGFYDGGTDIEGVNLA